MAQKNAVIVVGHGSASIAANTSITASFDLVVSDPDVFCTDSSTSDIPIRKWLWQVISTADASVLDSSTDQNTTFHVNTAGTYFIRLTVTNKNNATAVANSTDFDFGHVVVDPPNAPSVSATANGSDIDVTMDPHADSTVVTQTAILVANATDEIDDAVATLNFGPSGGSDSFQAVTDGTWYVRAFATATTSLTSTYTSAIEVEVDTQQSAPDSPTNFSATATSPGINSFTWDLPVAGETIELLRLHRVTGNNPTFTPDANNWVGGNVDFDATSTTDTTAAEGQLYTYKIVAYNGGGSADSNADTVTTQSSGGGGSVTPFFETDFSEFADTNALKAAFSRGGGARVFLSDTDGYLSSNQCMEFRFTGVVEQGLAPFDDTFSAWGNDLTASVGLNLPAGVKELWARCVVKYPLNMDTGNPNRFCAAVNVTSGSFVRGQSITFGSPSSGSATLLNVFTTNYPGATHILCWSTTKTNIVPGVIITQSGGVAGTVVSDHITSIAGGTNPDYKFMRAHVDNSGNTKYFGMKMFNGTGRATVTLGGSSDFNGSGVAVYKASGLSIPFADGQWHEYWTHCKLSSAPAVADGAFQAKIDSTTIRDVTGVVNDGTRISDYNWGENTNQQQWDSITIKYGLIELYFQDPGVTF